MTIHFNCNSLPATGAEALYYLRQVMEAAGWTCIGSGDGLSVYSASDGMAITSGNSGAYGMNNNKAWFRMKMPGLTETREFLFQRGAGGSENWKIRYAVNSPFSGGSPAAGVMPTSANSVLLVDDASGDQSTGKTIFPSPPNRVSFFADGSAPYGFGFFCLSAAGAVSTGFIYEAMQVGSHSSLDGDPYIFHWCGQGDYWSPNDFGLWSKFGGIDFYGTSRAKAYYKYGMTGESFTFVSALGYHNQSNVRVIPINLPVNPYSTFDNELSIPFVHWIADADAGWKGFSTYMRWPGVARPALSLLSVASAGAKDRIVLGTAHATFPWDGSDVLL